MEPSPSHSPPPSGSPLPPADLPFPAAFLDFLQQNGIDSSIYAASSIPRYIRVKPVYVPHLPEIEVELGCKLEKVGWLPHFFSLPPEIQIASTESYRNGKIYGIDAASGAAVVALDVSPGDHVLDVCAAPGAKLCMLSELLGNSGSLTGVDISRHRLAACRTMLQKYKLGDCCRLFVADGTTFSILPVRAPFDLVQNNSENGHDVFKEWHSKRCWLGRRNAKKPGNTSMIVENKEPELIFYGRHSGVVGLSRNELLQTTIAKGVDSGYDKVLVDAECTHDGSIKHIHKYEFWGWETLQHRLLDEKRIVSLTNLQLCLLENGFRLLKVGGTLVYSTCSLTVAQNESIVEKFLANNPLAELQEVEAAKNWPCRNGKLEKTIRFDPCSSQTSGLFIAKLVKLAH